jgi:murein DD-endopeptidase MepM/ murein hydrolase activator NlpD
LGTPIYAIAKGFIIEQVSKDTGFGLRVSQRVSVGGRHYLVVYGHMERVETPGNVPYNWKNKSRPVKEGQIIGYVDSTGFSTGNHLHLGMYEQLEDGTRLNINNGYQGAINPEPFLKDSMNQAKIVVSKNSPTVYICYAVPNEKHLEERASLEGISVPNPIPNSDTL